MSCFVVRAHVSRKRGCRRAAGVPNCAMVSNFIAVDRSDPSCTMRRRFIAAAHRKKEKETSMKSKRIIAPAMLVLALLLIAPAARAQVLQQVPSDALVVIKFNKLKPTSDKIAAMAQK